MIYYAKKTISKQLQIYSKNKNQETIKVAAVGKKNLQEVV